MTKIVIKELVKSETLDKKAMRETVGGAWLKHFGNRIAVWFNPDFGSEVDTTNGGGGVRS